MSDLSDRVRGTLLGLAAGDRIGGPIRMALRLAESLLDRQAFDPADVLARYLAWWKAGGFDTGPVAEEVFGLLDAGVSGEEALRRVHAASSGLTAGCNPAHRSPPLAMAAFLSDERLADLAKQEARLTHHHPLAGETAAESVLLCRRLIRGVTWGDAVALLSIADDRPLSRGGFAPDVLHAAIHFVGSHASFADALAAALSFAGAANYCPVLAGAIAGARWGASAVPAALIDHAIRAEAVAVTDRLAEGWA